MPYGDARDYIKRSNSRALWALKKATRYRRTVDRLAPPSEREALLADGLIYATGYPSPRGETVVTALANAEGKRHGSG